MEGDNRWGSLAAIALMCSIGAGVCAPASAQSRRRVEHAGDERTERGAETSESQAFESGLRLGLSADVVGYSELAAAFEGGGRESQTLFTGGLTDPNLGIDFGGFPLPFLGVGLVGWVRNQSLSIAADSQTDLNYGVVPYVEGNLRLGDVVVLDARLNIGVTGRGRTVSTTTVRWTAFLLGLRVGAHFFIIPEVSISPYASLDYLTGGAASEGSFSTLYGDIEGWSFSVGFALNGWFAIRQ